jgi:hypothetical protein
MDISKIIADLKLNMDSTAIKNAEDALEKLDKQLQNTEEGTLAWGESMRKTEAIEKALGRELLYRYIFGYPKKWSKRKVKKKGKKDMDLLKLETAIHLGFDGIKKLGSEYKQYIEENFEVEVKVRE